MISRIAEVNGALHKTAVAAFLVVVHATTSYAEGSVARMADWIQDTDPFSGLGLLALGMTALSVGVLRKETHKDIYQKERT